MTIHFLRKILENFENFFFGRKIRFGGRNFRSSEPNFPSTRPKIRFGKKISKNFQNFSKFSLGNVWS